LIDVYGTGRCAAAPEDTTASSCTGPRWTVMTIRPSDSIA